MKILKFKSKNSAIENCSKVIIKMIKKKPNSVFLFATGLTMIPLYKNLVNHYKKGEVDFSRIVSFNLDEYCGLGKRSKNSYRFFMDKYFFSKVNVKRKNVHFPISNGKKYEGEIKKAGGVDLAVLGIGKNAHIAFNEPGSKKGSVTRKVELSYETRKANSKFFSSINKVPKYAFSVGIKTILSSKKIILLAFGLSKSKAVYNSLRGKVGEKVPASFLRNHKDVSFILDKGASFRI